MNIDKKIFQIKNLKKYFPIKNGVFGSINNYVKAVDDVSFDLYEGDKLPKDKKSIALRVLLQPQEKTFTDQEIENISSKIIDSIKTGFDATLRQ